MLVATESRSGGFVSTEHPSTGEMAGKEDAKEGLTSQDLDKLLTPFISQSTSLDVATRHALMTTLRAAAEKLETPTDMLYRMIDLVRPLPRSLLPKTIPLTNEPPPEPPANHHQNRIPARHLQRTTRLHPAPNRNPARSTKLRFPATGTQDPPLPRRAPPHRRGRERHVRCE